MRKLVLGAAATVILLIPDSGLRADGLPERQARPYHRDCANFSGFYAGGHLGAAYYRADRTDQDGYLTFGSPATFSATDTAVAGGVQAGVNWQRHCTLLGIEADWAWTNAHADTKVFPNNPAVDFHVNSDLNNFGTLRMRSGLVVDNLLLYVTGGLAWADIKTTWRHFHGAHDDTVSYDGGRWGWTVGVGTEYMLTTHISLNAQTLYISLADEHRTHFLVPHASNFSFTHDDSAWVSRLAINFKFGDRRDAPLK